jgi:hypothetical protein
MFGAIRLSVNATPLRPFDKERRNYRLRTGRARASRAAILGAAEAAAQVIATIRRNTGEHAVADLAG